MDSAALGPDREQSDIEPGEVEMLEALDLELGPAVAEIDDRPLRARARDRGDLVIRKLPLGKNLQQFTTDIARGADHGDPITHLHFSDCCAGRKIAPSHSPAP